MKFLATTSNGRISMPEYTSKLFHDFAIKNPNIRLEITPVLPESRKLRGFYHSAVLRLWVYLDGADYRNHEILDKYHQVAKLEFNAESIVVDGKTHRIGKSTKGAALKRLIEAVITYLEENYGIDSAVVLNTELYRKFRDEVYMDGEFDDFISYMKFLKILK